MFANNVTTTEVSNQEVTTIDCKEDCANGRYCSGDIDATESCKHEIAEHETEDGVQDRNQKREKEENEDLPEECAVQHTIAGTDFAESSVFAAIVTTFGQFFQRKNGGARDEEDNTEIETDESHKCRCANVIINNALFSLDIIIVDILCAGDTILFAIVTEETSADLL